MVVPPLGQGSITQTGCSGSRAVGWEGQAALAGLRSRDQQGGVRRVNRNNAGRGLR
jgi:hypothetical protein